MGSAHPDMAPHARSLCRPHPRLPHGHLPLRVRKLMISTNICGKKVAESGYQIQYPLDKAFADWMKDSGGKELL